MTLEQIKQKYEKRILAVLRKIAREANAEGMKCTRPFEMSDEEYSWWLTVAPDGKRIRKPSENDIDVQFTIVESEVREGELGGVAFALDITSVGGRVIGGMTPYNYTDALWVSRNDEEAIEQRFAFFEQADARDAIALMRQ